MERRTFLGAAGALAGLPAVNSEVEPDAEVVDVPEWEDVGEVSKMSRPKREGVWSSTELLVGEFDEDSTVAVSGYHYEDVEPPGVELRVSNDAVILLVDVSPERAREIAEDLEAAADLAATGELDAEGFGGEAGGGE